MRFFSTIHWRYPDRRIVRRPPRGAVVLELILALPVLLIFLLAVVEFGLILAQLKHVGLASRVGAEAAAQTPGLSTVDGDAVPADVRAAIDAQLSASGMAACKVILEHNVPAAMVTLESGDCPCEPPGTPFPTTARYVRVTVCVPLSDLTPDLLENFGYTTAGQTVEHSSTFRYEL